MQIQIKRNTKQKKSSIQYTKILFNVVMTLVVFSVVAGMYINYKNGCSSDAIVSDVLESARWWIPSYLLKSLFETKEEKTLDFKKQKFEFEKQKFEFEKNRSTGINLSQTNEEGNDDI